MLLWKNNTLAISEITLYIKHHYIIACNCHEFLCAIYLMKNAISKWCHKFAVCFWPSCFSVSSASPDIMECVQKFLIWQQVEVTLTAWLQVEQPAPWGSSVPPPPRLYRQQIYTSSGCALPILCSQLWFVTEQSSQTCPWSLHL